MPRQPRYLHSPQTPLWLTTKTPTEKTSAVSPPTFDRRGLLPIASYTVSAMANAIRLVQQQTAISNRSDESLFRAHIVQRLQGENEVTEEAGYWKLDTLVYGE